MNLSGLKALCFYRWGWVCLTTSAKKEFNEKHNANLTSTTQSSDVCFWCHKQGHWANDGPKDMNQNGWSSKSATYVAKWATLEYHVQAKLKRMTSLKQNLTKTKPPVVKSAWYHTCRSLEKLLSNLSVKSLDDFQFFYYYYYYLLFFSIL